MTFFADLSGISITKATLVFPYTGVWHADLMLDRVPPISPPSLILSFVGMTLLCSAIRTTDFTGTREVRVVGGAGGWRQELPPKQYSQPFLSTVLLDAALTVGETVVVSSDRKLDAFVRRQAPASRVLQDLLPDSWWVDNRGITQTIPRVPTPVLSPFSVSGVAGCSGGYFIETESPGDWVPGAQFAALTAQGTVNRVTHKLEAGSLRTEVMAA